jgi:hypothetical protein
MGVVKSPRRDEVWLIRLDPSFGSEIRKTRPCLIVSPDEMNESLQTALVAPMTTTLRKYPTRSSVFREKRGRSHWTRFAQWTANGSFENSEPSRQNRPSNLPTCCWKYSPAESALSTAPSAPPLPAPHAAATTAADSVKTPTVAAPYRIPLRALFVSDRPARGTKIR